MKKIFTAVICFILLLIIVLPCSRGSEFIQVSKDDILFIDENGKKVDQAEAGDTISIKVIVHNMGDTTSRLTDFEFFLEDKAGKITPVLLGKGNITVSPMRDRNVSLEWDTGEKIDEYMAEPGVYRIRINYYPLPKAIEETEYNSGTVLSKDIEIKESTEGEVFAGLTMLQIGIIIIVILLVVVILILFSKRSNQKEVKEPKSPGLKK